MNRLNELETQIAELAQKLDEMKAEAEALRSRKAQKAKELRSLEAHLRAYNQAHGDKLFLMDAEAIEYVSVRRGVSRDWKSEDREFYNPTALLRELDVDWGSVEV